MIQSTPKIALYHRKLRLRLYQFVQKIEERQWELAGCFAVDVPSHVVKGKRILLLDDIYTSGSTFTEGAKTLLESGAKSVSALAFCGAPGNW